MSESIRDEAMNEVLPVIGERVTILNAPFDTRLQGTGEDIDCAVHHADPAWPLRLSGWRVCQQLWQGPGSRYWVVEREGRFVAIDTLDDPLGLAHDGFPTSRLAGDAIAEPGERAAYLAAKRIRKRSSDAMEWGVVSSLARRSPDRFQALLREVFGGASAQTLASTVLAGAVPGPTVQARARRARTRTRFRSPGRVARVFTLEARRVLSRLTRPTGITVVIAGPDGSGKSTLAAALPHACRPLFLRSHHLHWRPGVLPRPGSIALRDVGDSSRPHDRPPHGKGLSLLLLAYYWLDFALGSVLRIRPWRVRSGLVVVERGWWDILVDPLRYRLDVPPSAVRLLGRILPRPDVVFVLEAPSGELRGRKDELPVAELERQRGSWRGVPLGGRARFVDGSRPRETVLAAVQEEIVQILHERATSRLGAGWVTFPRPGNPRWVLPRGPRRVARSALLAYQPVTVRARVGWELGRALAAVGGFRLLPRAAAPPYAVRHELAQHLPPRCSLAVMRANTPGRHLALVVDERGDPLLFAKIGTDAKACDALRSERKALSGQRLLRSGALSAPRLLSARTRLLLFEAVRWTPRWRPWRLPVEVAEALGDHYAAGSATGYLGPAHGDCAPWNLLKTADGWVLVDWEEARPDAPPFADILHFVLRGNSHLGRPSRRAIERGLRGEGWVGEALRAYANKAGLDANLVHQALDEYTDYVGRGMVMGDRHTTTPTMPALEEPLR